MKNKRFIQFTNFYGYVALYQMWEVIRDYDKRGLKIARGMSLFKRPHRAKFISVDELRISVSETHIQLRGHIRTRWYYTLFEAEYDIYANEIMKVSVYPHEYKFRPWFLPIKELLF